MVKKQYGVIIGRMSPMHLGHRRLIQKMVKECGYKNSLLLIGSCNTAQSMRHFFSYTQRREFIKKIFPELRLMGLPDFPHSNGEWIVQLDDTLANCGFKKEDVKFYTGNEEDIEVIMKNDRDFTRLDRFDSTRPIISGEQVRAALVHEKPREELAELVGEDLVDDIIQVFNHNWPLFFKK